MTIIHLLIYVGVSAAILTAIFRFVFPERITSLFTSYLQNFAGILFLVSGFVKIVDPLGTAYKMVDYFTEFAETFEHSALSFIAPIFPFMSEYSIAVSLFTIVLEILLGYMLIVGAKPKFTAWAFFLLMLFFTALTGFTYLTGYVPMDKNFFDFASWGAYNKLNMRVQDCGCFGDFILLDPRVSFLKDVFLMFPAIYFLFSTKTFHRLFTEQVRMIGVFLVVIGFNVYGISNYAWDLPDFDFRPFKEGNNIRAMKEAEVQAASDVEIIALHLENKETKEVVVVPYEQYMKEYNTNFPKERFSVLKYEKTEPAIKMTKVSEFNPYDEEGYEYGDEIYESKEYNFIYVSYQPKGEIVEKTKTVQDTVWEDTQLIVTNKTTGEVDTVTRPKMIDVVKKDMIVNRYEFDNSYRQSFEEKVIPFMLDARKDGHNIMGLQGMMSFEEINDMKEQLGINFPVYQEDNILLKTIIRSNPGIFVLKDGVIIKKWHINKLPEYSEAKSQIGLK